MAKDNRLLGTFRLDGLPAAPRGVPQVEVSFDIDANGILNVTAKDKATGREQNITITSSSGLSDSEVDNLVKEAEQFESEDEERRQVIDSRNQLDNLVYQTEKVLGEHKESLPSDEIENVESAVAEGKEALDTDDSDRIKAAFDALTAASHKLAEVAYSAASAGAEGAPGEAPEAGDDQGSSDKGGDDVIDAEFEEA